VIEEVVLQELGRGRYERRGADGPVGYRNGFQPPRTIKTTLGPVELRRPKLPHAHSACCDQLFGVGVSRTNALETLVISAWVRKLSDRDVEALLEEVFGDEAKTSRSTASRIAQRLRAEFDAWKRRELSGSRIDYLYLDGSYFTRCTRWPKPSPCSSPGGSTPLADPSSWASAPGASESADASIAFLTDLTDRRMSAPLLVISDGGKGLAAAIERCCSASKHQRCTIHVARNVLAKVPKHAQADLKGDHWAIFNGIEGSGDEALAKDVVAPGASSPSGSPSVPQRAPVWRTTWRHSSPTWPSPPSTTAASGTPTCSSAPSGRPDVG
jgi:putative transposase